MNRTRTSRTAVAAAAALTVGLVGVPLVLAGPAQAQSRPRVSATAPCGSGIVKVKAKTEDGGRLEVEAELDVNRVGQSWNWTLMDNSTRIGHGTGVTRAPSGSFSVTRRPPNQAGSDAITFSAVRPATGATCTVSVTL